MYIVHKYGRTADPGHGTYISTMDPGGVEPDPTFNWKKLDLDPTVEQNPDPTLENYPDSQ